MLFRRTLMVCFAVWVSAPFLIQAANAQGDTKKDAQTAEIISPELSLDLLPGRWATQSTEALISGHGQRFSCEASALVFEGASEGQITVGQIGQPKRETVLIRELAGGFHGYVVDLAGNQTLGGAAGAKIVVINADFLAILVGLPTASANGTGETQNPHNVVGFSRCPERELVS